MSTSDKGPVSLKKTGDSLILFAILADSSYLYHHI